MLLKRIIIIGAGNVATHLAIALKNSGYIIQQIFSRNMVNAEVLSRMVDAEPVGALENIDEDADLYIISVSDAKIEEVAEKLSVKKGVVLHTAGSIDISVLKKFELYGVLYPFQTFTRDKVIDFLKVPVLIEGNNALALSSISDLANRISETVEVVDSKKRKSLHIAAVFVNNFVNHIYVLANDLVEKEGLDFSLLKPLILETTQKALSMNPLYAQTGPARRADIEVIEQHLNMLGTDSLHYRIYELISQSIMNRYPL